jgi:hypothetical protein
LLTCLPICLQTFLTMSLCLLTCLLTILYLPCYPCTVMSWSALHYMYMYTYLMYAFFMELHYCVTLKVPW